MLKFNDKEYKQSSVRNEIVLPEDVVHDLLPIDLVSQLLEPVWFLEDSVVDFQSANAKVVQSLE